jgi:hypothetical protein
LYQRRDDFEGVFGSVALELAGRFERNERSE